MAFVKTPYQIAIGYLHSSGVRTWAKTPEEVQQAAKAMVNAWKRGNTSPHDFQKFAEHNWKTEWWVHTMKDMHPPV